jgi:hypothetical protein
MQPDLARANQQYLSRQQYQPTDEHRRVNVHDERIGGLALREVIGSNAVVM